MLSLFSVFSSSVFVPFNETKKTTFDIISIPELNETLCDSINIIIALDRRSKLYHRYKENAYHVGAIFQDRIKFIFLDEEASKEYSKLTEVPLPSYTITVGTEQTIGVYTLPFDASSFCFHLQQLTSEVTGAIDNQDALFRVIARQPYTILTTENKFNDAALLSYQASQEMGVINVLIVTPHLLQSFGLDPLFPALFRMEDRGISSFNGTLDDLYEVSFPIFRVLNSEDIIEEDTSTFAIAAPELTEQLSSILYKIASTADIQVGYLSRKMAATVASIMGTRPNATVYAVLFDGENQRYIDSSSVFTEEFLAEPVEENAWVQKSLQLIALFDEDNSPWIYKSEDAEQSDSKLEKVVGTNYESFVLDPDHDSVILYKRPNCPHCTKFMPIFRAFAEECANYTYLRFGVIDISKNTAQIPYPYMEGVPHIRFFSAANKSRPHVLRGGRDHGALVRFVQLWSSLGNITIEAEPIDKTVISMEIMNTLMTTKDMPEDDQEDFGEFMKFAADLLGISEEEEAEEQTEETAENVTTTPDAPPPDPNL